MAPQAVKTDSTSRSFALNASVEMSREPRLTFVELHSSGRKGPIAWHTSKVNVDRTRQALKVLIDDFVVNPTYRNTVTSIEALNEPGGFIGDSMLSVAKQYYYDSYGALRWPYGNSTQVDTLLR